MKLQHNLTFFCAMLIATLFLISCSLTKDKPQKEFPVAIGFIQGQERFSDEIRQIVTQYLPKEFAPRFIFLRSENIDFSLKEVSWSMGIGGTIFALKEIGEGINFFPAMWERGCLKKTKLISIKEIKNSDINSFKKILIFHTDYPSPLALTFLYILKNKEIFETTDATKAIDALKQGKVDIIISETTTLHTTRIKKDIDLLPLESKGLNSFVTNDKGIPCRTLFFSPKTKAEDKEKIVTSLSNYPWENEKFKILPFHAVDMEEFARIQSRFNWKTDGDLRAKLKPL